MATADVVIVGGGIVGASVAYHLRADGFTGRVAIHPDQIAIINEAFSPTADELALARRVVDAFAAGAGAVSIDGKMYDIPHLKAARRLLASAQGTHG